MKIFVTVGGGTDGARLFSSLVDGSEFYGEWDVWTGKFIFLEDNNPDAVIEELEKIAEEAGLEIRCETEDINNKLFTAPGSRGIISERTKL